MIRIPRFAGRTQRSLALARVQPLIWTVSIPVLLSGCLMVVAHMLDAHSFDAQSQAWEYSGMDSTLPYAALGAVWLVLLASSAAAMVPTSLGPAGRMLFLWFGELTIAYILVQAVGDWSGSNVSVAPGVQLWDMWQLPVHAAALVVLLLALVMANRAQQYLDVTVRRIGERSYLRLEYPLAELLADAPDQQLESVERLSAERWVPGQISGIATLDNQQYLYLLCDTRVVDEDDQRTYLLLDMANGSANVLAWDEETPGVWIEPAGATGWWDEALVRMEHIVGYFTESVDPEERVDEYSPDVPSTYFTPWSFVEVVCSYGNAIWVVGCQFP